MNAGPRLTARKRDARHARGGIRGSTCARVCVGIASTPRCSSYRAVSRPQVGFGHQSFTVSTAEVHAMGDRWACLSRSVGHVRRRTGRGASDALPVLPPRRLAGGRLPGSRGRPDHPSPPLLPGVRPSVHHGRGGGPRGGQAQRRDRAVQPHEDHRRGPARPARAARSTRTRSRCSRSGSRRPSAPGRRRRSPATRSAWPSSGRCGSSTRSPTSGSPASTGRSTRWATSSRRSPRSRRGDHHRRPRQPARCGTENCQYHPLDSGPSRSRSRLVPGRRSPTPAQRRRRTTTEGDSTP